MDSMSSGPAVIPSRAGVAVIGAGYAGLSAALRLHDEGEDVLLLEAADRVGGRILSERLAGGAVVDHGGQWVGPTQRHLLALAERFDVAMFPSHTAGDGLELWHDGVVRTLADSADAPGMAQYTAAAERIDALALTIDLEDPSRSPDAEALDSETVHSYFERTVPDADARRRLDLAIQGVWAVEPRDISVLHMLFYVASAGGFDQLMETEGCAQDSRYVEGAQESALRIAALLADRVQLQAAVRRISQSARGVTVSTDRGDVDVDRVIFTLPPSAASRVEFDPPLPVARAKWWAKSPLGDVAKIHVAYATPFWRDRGLSGEASVYGDWPVGVVFDNSPADAAAGILVCFVYGDRLRRWSALDARRRRDEVVDVLVRLFGDAAAEPSDYTEKNWSEDPLVRGGYAANPAPGTWTELGAEGWRGAVGRIHWAGTETASVWNGYMDGAISSGCRAADAVLAGGLARR